MVVLVSLAACGSSGTTTTSSSGSAQSASPIVIGNIDTATGPLASTEGGFLPAMKAWAAWTNAHGGVNGHPLDLISLDDAGNPSTSLTDAQQLISQDHAIAIVAGTNEFSSWASYVASHRVPVIDGYQESINAYDFADGTPLIPTGSYGAFALAKQAGGTSVAFLYCTEIAFCAQAVPSAKTTAETIGLKFAYAGGVSSTAPNYTAICLAAQASHANILNVFSAAQTQINVATSCAQQSYKFILAVSALNFTNQWLTYPATNDAVSELPVFPFTDDSTPATQAFHDAMNKYASSDASSSSFGETYATAWTSGQEILEAAKLGHAGSGSAPATSQEMLAGLYAMHGDTLGGLAPPITYTQKANENSEIKCYFTLSIKNGKFVETQGLKVSCAP